MNAQARRAIRIAAPTAAAILLASCVKPYVPPRKSEPAAWIRLQYVYYTGERGGSATMGVRMFIREGQEKKFRPAFDQSLGWLSATENPKVPMYAMRIRPVENTAIQMKLGFEWGGSEYMSFGGGPTQSVLVPMSYAEGCSATQQFNPEPGKTYLASYTSLRIRCGPGCWLTECRVAIFVETPTGNGNFKLEPVGEPYVE